MPPITRRPLLPLLLLFTLLCATAVLAAERAPAAPAAALGRYLLAHELSGTFGYGNLMVAGPTDGRIYRTGANQQKLLIIDTRPTPAYVMITLPFAVAHMALSHDGGRLFLANVPTSAADRHIAVFDTATQTISGRFDYTCGQGVANCDLLSIAPGPDDRLYLAFANPAAIDVYDSRAGQRLTRFDHPDGAPGQMVIQGDNLYTVPGPQAVARHSLRRFDISDVTPVLQTTVPQTFPSPYFGPIELAADPNGAYVVAWQDRLDRALRLDPWSLATTGEYLLPNDATVWSAQISPTGDEVTLIGMYPDAYTFDAGGALRRFITPDLTYSADGYVVLPGHSLANVSPELLRVLRANDHLAFTPMVFADYCSGLFIDDFSDPTSGWPVADRGSVATYYDYNRYNGHFYAMLHRVPDAWSGVSRGDTWQAWPSLSVLTTAGPGVGSAGLIFGLNDDWSHFYSFEIIPEVERWVLYFYLDGWHIWATDEDGYISDPGDYTLLRLVPTPDGQLDLQIGYHTVFTFPEIPNGRVGLSGGSFYQGVGHSYDDFTIEPGPNCRPITRSNNAAPERSPLLPRPPLPSTP